MPQLEGEHKAKIGRPGLVADWWDPGGFCYNPARPGLPADVAQMVERLIRNQQVSGSIPLVGSMFSVGWAAPGGARLNSSNPAATRGDKKPTPPQLGDA